MFYPSHEKPKKNNTIIRKIHTNQSRVAKTKNCQNKASAEDLSITRIAGLTWDQWNARLAMPLVTQLREGVHPLVFPTDLSVNQDGANKSDLNPGFSCPDCGRLYKLKSSLRNHQKWECGKEPQFQCPFCVYRAKQKMHIGRHMERMHKEKFIKLEHDKDMKLEEGSDLTPHNNTI